MPSNPRGALARRSSLPMRDGGRERGNIGEPVACLPGTRDRRATGVVSHWRQSNWLTAKLPRLYLCKHDQHAHAAKLSKLIIREVCASAVTQGAAELGSDGLDAHSTADRCLRASRMAMMPAIRVGTARETALGAGADTHVWRGSTVCRSMYSARSSSRYRILLPAGQT